MAHRQRVCTGCNSFVTHEKTEENTLACPLCGHTLPPIPDFSKKVPVSVAQEAIKEFYRRAYEKIIGLSESNDSMPD